MEKSWSDAARAAWRAYPWPDAHAKARAADEAQRVAFGDAVTVDDLPLEVRRWLRDADRAQALRLWHGESWAEAVAAFERGLLEQVLAEARGNVAQAARLLRTTPRIVRYKAARHGLISKVNKDSEKRKG